MTVALCWGCGDPLVGMRKGAKFHSIDCRTLYRSRQAESGAEAFWTGIREMRTRGTRTWLRSRQSRSSEAVR